MPAPYAAPMHWCPRHTPRMGIVDPNRRTTSVEIPASPGEQGPGEMMICEGPSRSISVVRRHDATSHEEIERLGPSHIIISPGPCSPGEAGVSNDLVRRVGSAMPLLRGWLGHPC